MQLAYLYLRIIATYDLMYRLIGPTGIPKGSGRIKVLYDVVLYCIVVQSRLFNKMGRSIDLTFSLIMIF